MAVRLFGSSGCGTPGTKLGMPRIPAALPSANPINAGLLPDSFAGPVSFGPAPLRELLRFRCRKGVLEPRQRHGSSGSGRFVSLSLNHFVFPRPTIGRCHATFTPLNAVPLSGCCRPHPFSRTKEPEQSDSPLARGHDTIGAPRPCCPPVRPRWIRQTRKRLGRPPP
jgi:hypothetical protein